MSVPQLPNLTITLVSDTLSIYNTDSTVESIIIFNSKSKKLIGASNDQVTFKFAQQITAYAANVIQDYETTPLGKANFVKVNFGSNTLIIIPNKEYSICAIVKK